MMKLFPRSQKVTVDVYDVCKYEATSDDNMITVSYDGVIGFEVVSGKEAEEIEATSDCEDDYHEYLVLYFENGNTGTFRNSYVDMFLI